MKSLTMTVGILPEDNDKRVLLHVLRHWSCEEIFLPSPDLTLKCYLPLSLTFIWSS